jgi:predicted Zn-dependent peptidase
LVEAKLTPVKLGLLGFRTVPKGHKDELALKICNGILSNSNSTGLLDQLSLDNKLMAAQVLSMPYQDHGATIMLFVPKILGQKMDDAENLILAELKKLREGDFEDWMIDAIKYEEYKQYMQAFESVEQKALMITDAFALGKDIDELNTMPEKINNITKEDILRVANQYYGDNFLAFHSKMGFPKKNKIDKPGYEALKSNTNAKSPYAKHFDNIKTTAPREKYVDFNKDIKTVEAKGGITYLTKNPVNDIFSLTIKFGIGEHKVPMLEYAASAMNYAGTEAHDLMAYKKEFSKIGCTYGVYSNKSYTIIQLEGVEKNYNQAIKLLSELILTPVLDQKKIDKILEEVKTERKMETSEPDNVASALLDYVQHKEQSDFLKRLSLKEIKALQAKDLVTTFKDASNYYTEIHIVAQDINEKEKLLIDLLKLNEEKKPTESPVYIESEIYKENTVFFVNKKKSLQSKIYFLSNGPVFDNSKRPSIEAFNLYFGGGFSGLVLQEIREYRSLAYGAGARYKMPALNGKPSGFVGYIGTQADKTNEALEVFFNLVREMPEKTERSAMIKDYLIQSAFSDVPNFRDLSETIVDWKLQAYTQDPAIENVKAYQNFQFSDIVDFYKANVQKAPMVTVLVGNKKKIDMKKVEQYGKLIQIKESKLFN